MRTSVEISRRQKESRLARELVSLLLGKSLRQKNEKRSCFDWWCGDQKADFTNAPPFDYQSFMDYLRWLLGIAFG